MNRSSFTGRVLVAGLVALTAWVAGGCHLFVNPFADELAHRPAVTSPSVEVACEVPAEQTVLRRPYEPFEVATVDGTVTHGPLYFEDPFEDKGSEDGKFAWTGEDYLQMFYWRGRFLVNAVFFPVSVVVTPPWVLMASDGHLSRQALGMDHDAERWAGASTAEEPVEISD